MDLKVNVILLFKQARRRFRTDKLRPLKLTNVISNANKQDLASLEGTKQHESRWRQKDLASTHTHNFKKTELLCGKLAWFSDYFTVLNITSN